MKKLLLVLALLIVGASCAFAGTPNKYPQCYQGYGATSGNYNGTNGDAFSSKGWCIDGFGVFTPKNTTVDSTNPNANGGMAVPVQLVQTAPSAQTTFDSLLYQQTGNYIVDAGGFQTSGTPIFSNSIVASMATIDTLSGRGGHYVLPPAMPGEFFTVSSASKSTITVDVMTPALAAVYGFTTPSVATGADTIEWSPAGVGMAAGKNLQSTGGAGDSITLFSPAVGMWVVTGMVGSSNLATQDSLWTVISTQ